MKNIQEYKDENNLEFHHPDNHCPFFFQTLSYASILKLLFLDFHCSVLSNNASCWGMAWLFMIRRKKLREREKKIREREIEREQEGCRILLLPLLLAVHTPPPHLPRPEAPPKFSDRTTTTKSVSSITSELTALHCEEYQHSVCGQLGD